MRERQFGGPGVAAELEGGAGVVFDVDRGLLGLDEELARAADAEAVVRGLGRAADLDGVLVDDVLVGLGVAGPVVDVPAEGLEERVDELAADLGLVVVAGEIGVALRSKRSTRSRTSAGAPTLAFPLATRQTTGLYLSLHSPPDGMKMLTCG